MKRAYFLYLITFFSIFSTKAQKLNDCSRCLTEIITLEEIQAFSIDEVQFLLNDLYARKGFTFENFDLQAYFVGESWYQPTNNQDIIFNDIETQNIELFKSYIKTQELHRNDLLLNIRIFKELVQNKDIEKLQRMFRFPYTKFVENDKIKLLEAILEYIPFEKANFYKNNGYYRFSTDTGRTKTDYIFRIEGSSIHFLYNSGGLSEIIEKRNQYTTLLPDEGKEFTIDWEFLFENNQFTFVHFISSQ